MPNPPLLKHYRSHDDASNSSRSEHSRPKPKHHRTMLDESVQEGNAFTPNKAPGMMDRQPRRVKFYWRSTDQETSSGTVSSISKKEDIIMRDRVSPEYQSFTSTNLLSGSNKTKMPDMLKIANAPTPLDNRKIATPSTLKHYKSWNQTVSSKESSSHFVNQPIAAPPSSVSGCNAMDTWMYHRTQGKERNEAKMEQGENTQNTAFPKGVVLESVEKTTTRINLNWPSADQKTTVSNKHSDQADKINNVNKINLCKKEGTMLSNNLRENSSSKAMVMVETLPDYRNTGAMAINRTPRENNTVNADNPTSFRYHADNGSIPNPIKGISTDKCTIMESKESKSEYEEMRYSTAKGSPGDKNITTTFPKKKVKVHQQNKGTVSNQCLHNPHGTIATEVYTTSPRIRLQDFVSTERTTTQIATSNHKGKNNQILCKQYRSESDNMNTTEESTANSKTKLKYYDLTESTTIINPGKASQRCLSESNDMCVSKEGSVAPTMKLRDYGSTVNTAMKNVSIVSQQSLSESNDTNIAEGCTIISQMKLRNYGLTKSTKTIKNIYDMNVAEEGSTALKKMKLCDYGSNTSMAEPPNESMTLQKNPLSIVKQGRAETLLEHSLSESDNINVTEPTEPTMDKKERSETSSPLLDENCDESKEMTLAQENLVDPMDTGVMLSENKTGEDKKPTADTNNISFLLRPPVDSDEVEGAAPNIRDVIIKASNIFKSDGFDALVKHLNDNNPTSDETTPSTKKATTSSTSKNKDDGNNSSSSSSTPPPSSTTTIKDDARRYQIELFHHAKTRNTIISLGTGQGKTLIAILTIRHILTLHPQKQTWFLVPSVALAVQQAHTLTSNLPYSVAIACHTAACSDKARDNLSKAKIVVATHGSALDLLRHYGDTFTLAQVNLLVLDECHHAVKAHPYAVLMKKFYMMLEKEERPRVLGLTASPIINVPTKNLSEERLDGLLSELEETLDATLVSFSTLGLKKGEAGLIESSVTEKDVPYDNTLITGVEESEEEEFPKHEDDDTIHESRHKELDQLKYLCDEYGPTVVMSYTTVVLREVSRNHFERETVDEYERFRYHLKAVRDYCKRRCIGDDDTNRGKTGKLIALEELLDRIYANSDVDNDSINNSNSPSSSYNDTVGIIFVERRITSLALKHHLSLHPPLPHLKCDLLTRQTTHVFKYLSPTNHPATLTSSENQTTAHQEWLHKIQDSRDILTKLKLREINLLICTSVVEEGVDVDACSFVIVLDDLKTTKQYVQMKGRARRLEASFYVFRNLNGGDEKIKAPVSLEEAKGCETLIRDFIGKRRTVVLKSDEEDINETDDEENGEDVKKVLVGVGMTRVGDYTSCVERRTLVEREYRAKHGMVDMSSARSLINRYASSVPMDINSRSSRKALQPYLPLYSCNSLRLPSHLPSHLRTINLPIEYHTLNKRTKRSMLALMGCARLHSLHVLNDRLLPLKRKDIQKKLMSSALVPIPKIRSEKDDMPMEMEDGIKVMVYPIYQSGVRFNQHRHVLNAHRPDNRTLGVVSRKSLRSAGHLSLHWKHSELGTVNARLGLKVDMVISEEEWEKCHLFYETCMNGRWRRRTGRKYFQQKKSNDVSYVVARLIEDNGTITLDFEDMEKTIQNYQRTETKRRQSAKRWTGGWGSPPRLWAPIYDPNNTYISYGKEDGMVGSSPFPRALLNHDDEEKDKNIKTFQDYYAKKRGCPISPTCPLFKVQRLWQLPGKSIDTPLVDNDDDENSTPPPPIPSPTKTNPTCSGLTSVLLPQSTAMDAPIPDATLYLHLIFLPQILYELNRNETTRGFIHHCKRHFPSTLGLYVDRLPMSLVTESLTAKSCVLAYSYDRLEYLGDAVLKLLQTDALLQATDESLRRWVSCLHEGDLSSLRSAMGCNHRLSGVCRGVGFDEFILLRPLGRGTWVPPGLIVREKAMVVDDGEDKGEKEDKIVEECKVVLSDKVQADVVEALLGLVYLKFGYVEAVKVADELGLTLSRKAVDTAVDSSMTGPIPMTATAADPILPPTPDESKNVADELVTKAKSFLSIDEFNRNELLLEATTHPSKIHSTVSSYQRLEWIGDAVLCLAAREWVFQTYPTWEVKDLVQLETTLVCNETLALLGCAAGLHRYIEHCDSTLPARLEKYELHTTRMEQGLWGTDPPKVMADIVEALLGVAHVDGGQQQGQLSALFVVRPITDAIRSKETTATTEAATAMSNTIANEKSPSTTNSLPPTSDTQRPFRTLITHPKQSMLEICQSLKVRSRASYEFVKLYPNTLAWFGSSWETVTERNCTVVSEVTWYGVRLCALVDKESNNGAVVSKNRVCALVSELLNRDEELRERLKEMQEEMIKRKK